ncbi:MAG: nuclear transport factor 2 family protein [Planctomycetes bacterium]|nr:nuclear transport factor 2 family protein [Planctomycetota bacterium]
MLIRELPVQRQRTVLADELPLLLPGFIAVLLIQLLRKQRQVADRVNQFFARFLGVFSLGQRPVLSPLARHQVLNLHIEPVSATEAHVTHDMIVLEVADAPRVIATGRYDKSVVVKTAAGWRFKRRTLSVDGGFFKLFPQSHA